METLKKGSKGNEVKELQTLLHITADGIFGPGTEKAVIEFQKNHNLVADGIVGTKTWNELHKLNNSDSSFIQANPINVHISKANRQIKYIAIHYTAGRSSKAGMAQATRNVWLTAQASADFVVDDETILQVNPDPLKYYCWAVGDGKGKYGITNSNTISIEMCSTLAPGTSAQVPNHPGWSISQKVLDNTIKLTKYLMEKYNIPIDHVVRHYDASRKLCPGIIGWNDGTIYDPKTAKPTSEKSNSSKWNEFKKKLK